MKLLTGAVLSAALLATTPAFAGRDRDRDDDDHDRGHDKHYWKHQKKACKHYGPPQYVVRRDVHHYYAYQPEPVYYAPVYAPEPVYRPSPGIHVTLPNIYIPLR